MDNRILCTLSSSWDSTFSSSFFGAGPLACEKSANVARLLKVEAIFSATASPLPVFDLNQPLSSSTDCSWAFLLAVYRSSNAAWRRSAKTFLVFVWSTNSLYADWGRPEVSNRPRYLKTLMIDLSLELLNPRSRRKSCPNASGTAACWTLFKIACRFLSTACTEYSCPRLSPSFFRSSTTR